MTVDEIRATSAAHRSELDEFGIDRLAVCGSVARGADRPETDPGRLAASREPAGPARLQRHRSDWLGLIPHPSDPTSRMTSSAGGEGVAEGRG